MEDLSIAAARHESAVGKTATIRGWIRTRRDSKGGFSFLEVNDGSCFGNLQIVADGTLPNYEEEIRKLATGCSVVIQGEIKASPAKGQQTEMQASDVKVLGWADPETYPMQKKRHSFEYLRSVAHLRPRTNTFGAVTRVRNQICKSIHDFFQEREFFYVHTPIITASDCEGAGAMFNVTSMNMSDLPKTDKGDVDYSKDFFERKTHLTVSGQLEAEIFACGLGKVYTFGPTFRAENSNTSRHLAEFWMIEPEMAFYDLNDNMALAEAFIKRLAKDVIEHCAEDMEFFQQRIDKTILETLQNLIDNDFLRLSYTEAVEILQKSDKKFDYAVEWGRDLQSEHERYLTEEVYKKPVILFDYPASIKPFYMRVNDEVEDPARLTVRAMDVLVPKVGEIIGGSQREERLDILIKRMQEQQLSEEEYWWYVELRKFGTVPHAGFGLGLERIVQFITGMENIRDVIPFPRTPGSADF